jgi:hypothetical protein
VSGGVVGPPRVGVTPQLLRGEEGLLHLGAAQEPKLGLHHSKPVVGLQRSYPSQARESVDSNLAAAREVLGVVDELLMNLINFHVDDPSHLSMVTLTDFKKGFPRMMEVC